MKNKTAVITGATSGIGAAFARKFAQEGYQLILTGRRREIIESVAEQLRHDFGVAVEVVLAELSDTEDISRLIDHMAGKEIEILVNNAGFGVSSLFQNSELEVVEQLAKVNVLAPMALIRAVLPGMLERGKGTIINISSESVYLIVPKNAVYSGAKAFLKSFTEGLYMDLVDTGVRVIAVCPGLTHTDFHEKMGMDKARQKDRGAIKWMAPDKVVESTLHDLKKGKVICIPGMHTKVLTHMLNLMPRRSYYRFMVNFSRKNFGKKAG